jgi:hypothetical protein
MTTKKQQPAQPALEVTSAPTGALVPFAAVAGGLATSLGSDWAAELAAKAKDVAAAERAPVGKISLKGGILSYMDQPAKGNVLDCVILLHAYENVWYKDRYDPNKIVNPNCFAVGLSDDKMVPHENVKEPIHASCSGCPYNQWASDPNGGRGKACKERRRLILLPANALESVETVKKAELALVGVPVMSVKNWAIYVNLLAGTANIPPYAAVTRLSTERDPKAQFKLTFEPQSVIADPAILRAVEDRMEDARKAALTPYDAPEDAAPAPEQKGPTKF